MRNLTNTQLLAETDDHLLTELQKQRRFLLGIWSLAQPCPGCGTKQTLWEAAGKSLDDFSLDYPTADQQYHCKLCNLRIEYMIPFFAINGPWFWGKVKE